MANAAMRVQTESDIYEGNATFKHCLVLVEGNVVLTLLLGIGLVRAWWQSKSLHVRVTNERITIREGVLTRKEEDLDLVRVQDIACVQTILGRIFGCGVIRIISTDRDHAELQFPADNPMELRERIRAAVRAEKDRLGVRYQQMTA